MYLDPLLLLARTFHWASPPFAQTTSMPIPLNTSSDRIPAIIRTSCPRSFPAPPNDADLPSARRPVLDGETEPGAVNDDESEFRPTVSNTPSKSVNSLLERGVNIAWSARAKTVE
jgi:hypothetical protein